MLKRLYGIPLLTDQLWSLFIERTSLNKAPRLDMAIKDGTQAQHSVKLVRIGSLLSFHTGDLHFKSFWFEMCMTWRLSKYFFMTGLQC